MKYRPLKIDGGIFLSTRLSQERMPDADGASESAGVPGKFSKLRQDGIFFNPIVNEYVSVTC